MRNIPVNVLTKKGFCGKIGGFPERNVCGKKDTNNVDYHGHHNRGYR